MSEDHVSQPMAQRLRDAGWKGETEKAWVPYRTGFTTFEWQLWETSNGSYRFMPGWLPAPSIGELLVELPEPALIKGVSCALYISRVAHDPTSWAVWYESLSDRDDVPITKHSKNLADALAGVWLAKEGEG